MSSAISKTNAASIAQTKAPVGIDIPAGFSVSFAPSPRVARGRWTHLVTQDYETTQDSDTDAKQGCREFLSLRKMAACVLPVCPNEKKYLLIRQFRYPAYHNSAQQVPETFQDTSEENGWLYEVIAGVIEPGDTAEQTIIREAKEEGDVILDSSEIKKVHHCFMTPGITNEEMHIYLGLVDATGSIGATGLAKEGEQIRAKWMDAKEIRTLHKKGLIRDAKTLLALYAARVL